MEFSLGRRRKESCTGAAKTKCSLESWGQKGRRQERLEWSHASEICTCTTSHVTTFRRWYYCYSTVGSLTPGQLSNVTDLMSGKIKTRVSMTTKPTISPPNHKHPVEGIRLIWDDNNKKIFLINFSSSCEWSRYRGWRHKPMTLKMTSTWLVTQLVFQPSRNPSLWLFLTIFGCDWHSLINTT